MTSMTLMTPTTSRSGVATFVCLLLVLSATSASAQEFAGSTFEMRTLLPDGDNFKQKTAADEIDFFNLANCVCNKEFAVEFKLPSGDATVNEDADVWIGTDCDQAIDQEAREQQCQQIHNFSDVVENLRSPQNLSIGVGDLASPTQDFCDLQTRTQGVFLLVEDDNINDNTFLGQAKLEISVDAQPPPIASSTKIQSGEEALVVTWNSPVERSEDVKFYQFLCARADGAETTISEKQSSVEFTTALGVCGADDGTETVITEAASKLPSPPSGLESMNTDLLCGTASGTEQSARLSGLENGVKYRVYMLSIDDAQNATRLDIGEETPQPVKDFWEDYNDRGGPADGGLCLISETYGDNHPFTDVLRDFRDGSLASSASGRGLVDAYYQVADPAGRAIASSPALRAFAAVALLPTVAVAAAWTYTGAETKLLVLLGLLLLGTQRRRQTSRGGLGTRVGAAGSNAAGRKTKQLGWALASAVILLLVSSQALAQSAYQPYGETWDDDDTGVNGSARPLWNLELKLGTYLPEIDQDKFSADKDNPIGPFEQTFENKRILQGVIELQRFFAFPVGQLGLAASVGILGDSADAFQLDENGAIARDMKTDELLRAKGNKVRFRMVPMSLGAVYRFTHLDERYHIPIVPYAKLGLSYYLWWVRAPNGELAEAADSGCADPTSGCSGDKALGASLGWQASIGIALRAERIDKAAAVGLRNDIGIMHAGFFFEFFYADVDGFGAKNKLRVGDKSWLAGINFEF